MSAFRCWLMPWRAAAVIRGQQRDIGLLLRTIAGLV